MSGQVDDEKMIKGHTTVEFIRFVLPSILGLLAMSSAGVVDGLFVGNYVGTTALAAVNLVVPIYSVFFGLCVMLLVGAAVIAGKFLGQGDIKSASNIFTKSFIVVVVYGLIMSTLGWFYAEPIAKLLGASGEVLPFTVQYIKVLTPFLFFMGVCYALSYFARVDGAPNFSLFGLIIVAATNIGLDWLFIGKLHWGIEGAAFASGIAYTVATLFYSVRLFSAKARIRLIRPYGSWLKLFRAAYNGLSEFINEMSGGLLMFVINWILMTEVGSEGVAAFTIVNYVLWLSVMVGYGTSEALAPLVSVNFGAHKADRIVAFMRFAMGMGIVVGIIFATMLLTHPDALASAFLTDNDMETKGLTLIIIASIWPALLFNGLNIIISGYFTGMHGAMQSAAIAMSRSLVLPLLFIMVFWKALGVEGAFYAIPAAEILTFILSLFLFYKASPTHLVEKDRLTAC